MSSHKVVGYVSIGRDRFSMFCDGPACIVAGTDELMKSYLMADDPVSFSGQETKKTRFGEVLEGLKLGAEYQFDEHSFERFEEVAKKLDHYSQLWILPLIKNNIDLKFFNVKLAADQKV